MQGWVLNTTEDRMVVEHSATCRTTYLFGPERATERNVWADCECGEKWRLKGDSIKSAVLLKALHEEDPWGARFIQVLADLGVEWASPGRETTAFTAYIGDVMVGMLDPSQNGSRSSSVALSWQYGVQVCDLDGQDVRTHTMFLSGKTALFLALAEVSLLLGDLRPLEHPMGVRT
jgi:hypothetical protein